MLCNRLLKLVTISLFLFVCMGDMYMHTPPGSNNRLDERTRDRNNGNRLFDSQNNDRGGYNVGKVSYYTGEKFGVSWTQQHSTGTYQMGHSEIILQYGCDERIRDGTSTRTIPDQPSQCLNYDCDTDPEFGRHESYEWYQYCKATKRNEGLFTANQNLNGNSAKYTRQNPDGTRRGYECPEERDYYPYWRPTMWRDLAIITADQERCANYQEESQNVQAKGYCKPNNDYWIEENQGRGNKGELPITQSECNNNEETFVNENGEEVPKYSWVEVSEWDIPEPECSITSVSRANHHGLVEGTNEIYTHWMVFPESKDVAAMEDVITNENEQTTNCVMRVRYNITTDDYAAWESSKSVAPDIDAANNAEVDNPNPDNDPANLPLWEAYGLSYEDVRCNFEGDSPDSSPDADDDNQKTCRGYVFRNNPRVDPFGFQLDDDDADSPRVQLQLAVNTNQFGRTFQDRSHTFVIRDKPETDFEGDPLDPDATLSMVTVRGKRGNIVQVYPATEYFFFPDDGNFKPDSYVHFCWAGSNQNPNNNDGQGQQGTDRSNLCPLVEEHFSKDEYFDVDGNVQDSKDNQVLIGDLGNNYPSRLTGSPYQGNIPDPDFANERNIIDVDKTGLSLEAWKQLCLVRQTGENQLRDAGNMEELDGNGPNQCFAPMKFEVADGDTPTKVNFLSTRNNNFSNRSQKGAYTVGYATKVVYVVSSQQSGVYQSVTGEGAVLIVEANMIDGDSIPVEVESSDVDAWATVSFQESALENDGWFELWIPYTPEALSAPKIYYRETDDDDWEEHEDGEKGYRNGKYMASTTINKPGTYKVENELDDLALACIIVSTILFGICLGCVLFFKCQKK